MGFFFCFIENCVPYETNMSLAATALGARAPFPRKKKILRGCKEKTLDKRIPIMYDNTGD